jgi:hypothetical protein
MSRKGTLLKKCSLPAPLLPKTSREMPAGQGPADISPESSWKGVWGKPSFKKVPPTANS